MMTTMTTGDLRDVMAVYAKIWPGSPINDEKTNIWYMAIGRQDRDRVIATLRDYASRNVDHKPPTPGKIAQMMSLKSESQRGLTPQESLPPRNELSGEFWADMGRVSAGNISLRQKLEAIAKWGGIDESGNPLAPRPTGLSPEFMDAIREDIAKNGLLGA
jgi:hypothetical protein|tara:strand:+ start:130 stop:609 length:480 start_codon:yes stop_codon:yes gene_type:complete